MYKTFEEAKIAALEAIKKHGYKNMDFVIVEYKMIKNAKPYGFTFRGFVNENFDPEWHELSDRSWSRMIEVVAA